MQINAIAYAVLPSYEILVGLVIHSSANAEDGQIAKNIEVSLQATS